MVDFEEIKLIPKWKKVKSVDYSVYRKDFFRYAENIRYPIENEYDLAINHLNTYPSKIELEASYPNGLLKLLTSFQPYSAFLGKEKRFSKNKGNKFSYTVNRKGKIKSLTNLKQINKYGFWLEKAIDKSRLKKKNYLKESISYFLEDEAVKKDYLLRDLDIIHAYYGRSFSEPMMIDLTEDTFFQEEEVELNENKIPKEFKKIVSELKDNYSGLCLLDIQQSETELIINHIWGVDLLSVDVSLRHDFSKIKNTFIKGEFDIENYSNVTLHQKIYKYSKTDKILNFFSHKQRTVSDKMDKILDVVIKRKKAKILKTCNNESA